MKKLIVVMLLWPVLSFSMPAEKQKEIAGCESAVESTVSEMFKAKYNRNFEVVLTDKGFASADYGGLASFRIFTVALYEESGAFLYLVTASPVGTDHCSVVQIEEIWNSDK